MRVICLAGWSGSGKTTLVTKVIPVLVKRGLKLATVGAAELAAGGQSAKSGSRPLPPHLEVALEDITLPPWPKPQRAPAQKLTIA